MFGPGYGAIGGGGWFDGSKLMEIPNIAAMNVPDISVTFWMYLLEDSTNAYRTILRKAVATTDMTPAIMLLPNERRLHVRIALKNNAGGGLAGFDSSAIIPLRRWTHIAYVVKGGATLTLYVNGVKDCPVLGANRAPAACPPSGTTYAWDEGDVKYNAGPLYVGGDPFMSGAAMFLDELKIFNKPLLESEVAV